MRVPPEPEKRVPPEPGSPEERVPLAPAREPAFSRAGLAAAGLLALWYLATMGRGLDWFDSAELALVGQTLGVGHPPGQPTYTLLSGLASLGPWPPLVGLNALSALTAAACALPFDSALRRFVPALGAPTRLLLLLVAGAAAPIWDQASRIELYAPATLLLATVLALATARAGGPARRWWLPGLLVGLLAGVNALFAVAAALGAAALALGAGRWRRPKPVLAQAGVAAAAAALGLATHLQPVLAARAGDRFVWGDWHTLEGVQAVLTGADYAHTAHSAWGQVPAHLLDWLGFLGLQGCLAATLVGLVGLGTAAGRRAAAWWVPALVLGLAFTFTYGAYFPEVPDYNGYLMPLLWCAVLGLGALLARLPVRLAAATAAALLLLSLATGERPIWARTRADLAAPVDHLARSWLEATPPGGVLLLASDHLVFPVMYLQRATGLRPDVVVVNVGFASSGWFWRDLFRLHPTLPPFDLRAPSREVRLQRFLATVPERAVRAESLSLAVALGRRPCLDTFGLRLEPHCAGVVDDAATAVAAIAAIAAQAPDPISPRVAAQLAFARAEAAWALGDASTALTSLVAGLAPGPAPSVPPGLARPAHLPPLVPPQQVLIGDPTHLRNLGQAVLEALGRPEAAATWAAEGQ